MAVIVWADVTAVAAELTTTAVASDTRTYVLDYVNNRAIDGDVWGEFADDGKRYLAAHMATMAISGSGGAAGPVILETLGPMSRSYATTASTSGDDSLSLTRYGREYLRLLRIAVAVPGIVP